MSELPQIEQKKADEAMYYTLDKFAHVLNDMVIKYPFLREDPVFLGDWVAFITLYEDVVLAQSKRAEDIEGPLRTLHNKLVGYLRKCRSEHGPAILSLDGERFDVPESINDFDHLLETARAETESGQIEIFLSAAAETILSGDKTLQDYQFRHRAAIESTAFDILDQTEVSIVEEETGDIVTYQGHELVDYYGGNELLHLLGYRTEFLNASDLGEYSQLLKEFLRTVKMHAKTGSYTEAGSTSRRDQLAGNLSFRAVEHHLSMVQKESEDSGEDPKVTSISAYFKDNLENTLESSSRQ